VQPVPHGLRPFRGVSGDAGDSTYVELACPNGRAYGAGEFNERSVPVLRAIIAAQQAGGYLLPTGDVTITHQQVHDIMSLHGLEARYSADAPKVLFQAASRFNYLDSPPSPETAAPSCGVTQYLEDSTQGPACARACLAAAFYRSWYLSADDAGHDRQMNGLRRVMDVINREGEYLRMEDGKVLAGPTLKAKGCLPVVGAELEKLVEDALMVGMTTDAEAILCASARPSSAHPNARGYVSTAWCASVPFWNRTVLENEAMVPLALAVVRALYKATLLEAVSRGVDRVYLTFVGMGVFLRLRSRADLCEDSQRFIKEATYAAIRDAVTEVQQYDRKLDVRVLHYAPFGWDVRAIDAIEGEVVDRPAEDNRELDDQARRR